MTDSEQRCDSFVGVFDSGAGGVSVLAELVRTLPNEDFSYFGDSLHVPYGEKGREWIETRSHEIAGNLIDAGAKPIVIACNTATAAAAESLRAAYPDIPIIGMEPALKPAVESGARNILVMATPATLSLDKYNRLEGRLAAGRQIIDVPCDGLAARIEQGDIHEADLEEMLASLVGKNRGQVDAVVLGCTHYPLAADTIRNVLGDVPLFDGRTGTARQLKRRLSECGLTAEAGRDGEVSFASSGGEQFCTIYKQLFASIQRKNDLAN